VTHTFPLDGEYLIKVRLWRNTFDLLRGMEDPHQIEVALDGARLQLITVGGAEDFPAMAENPGTFGAALDRLAGAVGLASDINLESEDFNRKFRVSASSPKLASDILTPRTMQYLIGVDAGAWRTCGSDLVGFRQGTLDPADVVRTCSVLGQVQAGIPSFVWKDAGGSATGYSPGP